MKLMRILGMSMLLAIIAKLNRFGESDSIA